ncbi:MAG: flavin oxidoreductase/NADH oxidase [Clostridia bacterium]|nr:flavin oxidoreductase/NADH oxidase [Clostridia bacterium]
MEHKVFAYKDLSDLTDNLIAIGQNLCPNQDSSVLARPLSFGSIHMANRIAFQAMEGCDGEVSGEPSELTRRRYRRFAASGAAFQYVEATAVDPCGRANPLQLMINEQTAPAFAELVKEMRAVAKEKGVCDPYIAIQLTHSGRYSKAPDRSPAPVVAYPDPERDPKGVTPTVITDQQLDALEEKYVQAARLAKEAGFDCVDIKCCHGYLLSELMGARLRKGRYGGSFENRSRLLNNITRRIHDEVGIAMMVRLNVHDEYPYPYGFGVDEKDFRIPDLTEPKQLVDMLIQNGVSIIDCTAGNPYYNPHVNRPFDVAGYVPPVSQLEQLMKHLNTVRELKEHNPNAIYIASMFTWLRQFAPHLAAAAISTGWFDMAGWGRQTFAYPSFPREIMEQGEMDPKRCCIACSKCTDLMRTGNVTGCVVRDPFFRDLYQSIPAEQRPRPSKDIREHI